MRAFDILRHIASTLNHSGIENPDKEAESIIREVVGIERVKLYSENPILSRYQIEAIGEIVIRRENREPIQYIFGYAEFYGIKIKVGKGVLIPRPETELVVEQGVKILKENPEAVALDLCTGSGAIAVSLAKHISHADIYAVDVSESALRYAEENKEYQGLKNMHILKGWLFEPVRGMRFDLIVSNPPYIKSSIIDTLQPEVRDWEPKEALNGKEDGLYFFKEILKDAPVYLNPGGSVILEVGQGQAEEVVKIAKDSGLGIVSKIKDYADIERVLVLR